ncbi:MAG: hypothetical protein JWN40_4495 [Phycisphaerales bacterium]|nr:hypothetical protein [Phycisphaerales bacterium]
MNWRLFRMALLCVVVGWSLTAGADGPEAPATEAQLQQMFKDGDFQGLALKATRVLQLKGDAAKAYNRPKVMMLKGEAQLRLKQVSQALDAFAGAAKESTDAKEAATATATEMLVRKSPGLKYTVRPKGGGKSESLDILDEAGRKQAMSALYADEAAIAAPKIKAGESAKTLPIIIEALKTVSRLGALEQAATGSEEKTTASAKELGTHAQTLMTEAVRSIAADVQKIGLSANSVTRQSDGNGGYLMVKRGLSPVDTRALRADVDNGGKIADAAKELSAVTKVASLGAVASDATRAVADAQRLLDTDFSTARGGGTMKR